MMSNAHIQVLQAPGHSSTEGCLFEINFVSICTYRDHLCELDARR